MQNKGHVRDIFKTNGDGSAAGGSASVVLRPEATFLSIGSASPRIIRRDGHHGPSRVWNTVDLCDASGGRGSSGRGFRIKSSGPGARSSQEGRVVLVVQT
jgi:hypothetical protein